ncbi:Protein CBG25256 [Caenorhabditis briggsae]|uniref:Protein CBG25256 n=1 Tax=Caenorhabditis briggsae TaxID=6238 RepID=B6IFM6_CAEBR|nr:Protein CBG25256 [Caenorhabditis briggsae]CAR98706.1 Protein CBG25256 [Caenorhabditis briggsae]
MVSIGAFIKLLLLVSFVLCTKEEFSKLSDAEITETLSKCGKFKDLKEGISKTKDDVLLAYISPRHFLTDIRILTNYHSMECGTRGNSVSNFLNTTGNFSAKLIGECKNEPTGMILGDSHPENKHPQDKWFCVRNNKMEINEDVQVVMGANVDVSAKITTQFLRRFFCTTVQKLFVIFREYVKRKKNFYAWICAVLFFRSSQTTSTPQQTSTTSINSTSVVPTTFQPTTIQNSNVTLSTTVSISATATTGNSLTKEPATTASLSTPSPQSTESITVNHQTTIKVPSTPDQRPTTIPPAIPSKVTVPSHPQAEALKSLEVDCEEENLCFEEDIFAFVAGANSILNSLAIFFIVFLFQ